MRNYWGPFPLNSSFMPLFPSPLFPLSSYPVPSRSTPLSSLPPSLPSPLLSTPLSFSHLPFLPFLSLPLKVGPMKWIETLQLHGLGQSPSRNPIRCILALKSEIWWQRFQWLSWELTDENMKTTDEMTGRFFRIHSRQRYRKNGNKITSFGGGNKIIVASNWALWSHMCWRVFRGCRNITA